LGFDPLSPHILDCLGHPLARADNPLEVGFRICYTLGPFMQKVNVEDLKEKTWTSPQGKFGSAKQEISVALGLDQGSNEVTRRHPFDVTICRVPSGKALCPYHSHSAQWEFYHVISGRGQVRDETGLSEVEVGDAFIFRPGEAHQILNPHEADLILYIVADNPPGETCYYPDSKKWLVRSPDHQLIRGDSLDYLDGEE